MVGEGAGSGLGGSWGGGEGGVWPAAHSSNGARRLRACSKTIGARGLSAGRQPRIGAPAACCFRQTSFFCSTPTRVRLLRQPTLPCVTPLHGPRCGPGEQSGLGVMRAPAARVAHSRLRPAMPHTMCWSVDVIRTVHGWWCGLSHEWGQRGAVGPITPHQAVANDARGAIVLGMALGNQRPAADLDVERVRWVAAHAPRLGRLAAATPTLATRHAHVNAGRCAPRCWS